jgi:hypothetical protein
VIYADTNVLLSLFCPYSLTVAAARKLGLPVAMLKA